MFLCYYNRLSLILAKVDWQTDGRMGLADQKGRPLVLLRMWAWPTVMHRRAVGTDNFFFCYFFSRKVSCCLATLRHPSPSNPPPPQPARLDRPWGHMTLICWPTKDFSWFSQRWSDVFSLRRHSRHICRCSEPPSLSLKAWLQGDTCWCIRYFLCVSLRGCCRCALMTKSHECLQHVDYVLLTPPPPTWCSLQQKIEVETNRKLQAGGGTSLTLLVPLVCAVLSGCVLVLCGFLHVSSCRVVRQQGSNRPPYLWHQQRALLDELKRSLGGGFLTTNPASNHRCMAFALCSLSRVRFQYIYFLFLSSKSLPL